MALCPGMSSILLVAEPKITNVGAWVRTSKQKSQLNYEQLYKFILLSKRCCPWRLKFGTGNHLMTSLSFHSQPPPQFWIVLQMLAFCTPFFIWKTPRFKRRDQMSPYFWWITANRTHICTTYPCSGIIGAIVLQWRRSISTVTSSGGYSSNWRMGSRSTAFWCWRRNSSKSTGSTTSQSGTCCKGIGDMLKLVII